MCIRDRDNDVSAGFRELQRNRLADSTRRTCYNGNGFVDSELRFGLVFIVRWRLIGHDEYSLYDGCVAELRSTVCDELAIEMADASCCLRPQCQESATFHGDCILADALSINTLLNDPRHRLGEIGRRQSVEGPGLKQDM